MLNRSELNHRIVSYRFALYDLALYQDSHPCDQQAIKLRQIYTQKLEKLIDEYEKSYGAYILTQADAKDSWAEWVAGPWPWEITKGDGRHVAI